MLLITEQLMDTTQSVIIEESGKKNLYIEGIFMQAEKKNRNGRIYSQNILEDQVNKYVASHVNTNRALGELNHPQCYFSNDFDVLTDIGWKKFVDLVVGDSVVGMTGNSQYTQTKITNITSDESYTGDCIRILGRNIDSTVTPQHRFYIEDRYGKILIKTAQELYDDRHTSKQRHSKIIKQLNYTGESPNTITFTGVDVSSTSRYNNDITKDLEIDTETFVKFLGFYLAEGNISKEKYSIMLCQNEGDISAMVDEMFLGFPPEIKINKRVTSRVSGNFVNWSFSDRRIHDYLLDLGNCYTKYIPDTIMKLDKKYLELVVEWFGYGDGRRVTNGSEARIGSLLNIFSTSKRLIDDLQTCAIKCGWSGNITENCPLSRPDYMFAGHLIEAKNKRMLYVLNISKVTGIYLSTEHKFSIDKIPHPSSGAYCITTETGNFYIRDKGKVYLTGNSPSVNPENASHRITELKIDGNNFIGKALVLNTPKGNIVRGLLEGGTSIGVSSRGLGSVKMNKNGINEVQSDYRLVCVDIVSDPSAPEAFVNGIMEGHEWVWDSGQPIAQIEKIKKLIMRTSARRLEEAKLQAFSAIFE